MSDGGRLISLLCITISSFNKFVRAAGSGTLTAVSRPSDLVQSLCFLVHIRMLLTLVPPSAQHKCPEVTAQLTSFQQPHRSQLTADPWLLGSSLIITHLTLLTAVFVIAVMSL